MPPSFPPSLLVNGPEWEATSACRPPSCRQSMPPGLAGLNSRIPEFFFRDRLYSVRIAL
ncbi:hypothetical protein BDP55DRAFT_658662 [Colletotrichum godetiae]|uniref:Uncharacterized protein n=1 Tax=Colletotrichum godetiae TaxID=1209918 RepID=A0AAJ0F046_9PEZI|nr:uncharacterized protein BDP55DRAFT_658662 [Colletotrichum godetiae]KAK1688107.1 hypothetical protein BDP55DRAFT_658662 [Colletotrichum godetiae]